MPTFTVSLTLPDAEPPEPQPPDPGTGLTHGARYKVSGTGFGTKDGSNYKEKWCWDNCSHGEPWTARYTRRWHDGTEGYQEDYRVPAAAQNVALPHPNITRYLCGAQAGTGSDAADVFVSKDYTPPAAEWWEIVSFYFRFHPSWEFQHTWVDDHNIKLAYVTRGGKWPATGGYAYICFAPGHGPNLFMDATQTGWKITYQNAGDGSQGMSPNIWDGAWPVNPCQGWAKLEMITKYSTGSSGKFIARVNDRQLVDAGFRSHTGAVTSWQHTIGGYSRDRGTNNWRYWADLFHHVSANNLGRFYLTNSATAFPSSVSEVQPFDANGAYTDTAVDLLCNHGALPKGKAHLWFVDEARAIKRYVGERTLA